MFVGRLVGWALVGLALLMASGDMVMALGPGDHLRLATRDVWILLAGRALDATSLPALGNALLAWPAWTLLAPFGILLVWLCRPRRRRYRFRDR